MPAVSEALSETQMYAFAAVMPTSCVIVAPAMVRCRKGTASIVVLAVLHRHGMICNNQT